MPKGLRTVIAGGGFGGLLTALELARQSPENEVVLIDRNVEHVYSPWLYEVATGELYRDSQSADKLMSRLAGLSLRELVDRADRDNLRFRQAEVVDCDFMSHHLILDDDKTLEYNFLVLALGSKVNDFGLSGVAEYAAQIKTLDDAIRLRQSLADLLAKLRREPKKSVVVAIAGAGATGVELAAELAVFRHKCEQQGKCPERTIRLILIEADKQVLNRFPPKMQTKAAERLKSLGVELYLGTMVKKLMSDKVILEPRPLASAEIKSPTAPIQKLTELPVNLFIWTGGITANQVVRQMSLPKDEKDRIKVLPTLQVEGHPHVFALGDNAAQHDPYHQGLVPPTAQVAVWQAPFLARNIACALQGRELRAVRVQRYFGYVVPIGGARALAHFGYLQLGGRIGYWLRCLVDLRYLMMIMSPRAAWSHWCRALGTFKRNS